MNRPPAAETDMIRRARRGDDHAFESLVLQYNLPLYRVVVRMTGDKDRAEAIVQEAFLKTWLALPRYREDRPFFPYIVTVATNIFRDQWRKDRKLDFGDLDEMEDLFTDPTPHPEEQVVQKERLDLLAAAVAELPAHYRSVIALRYDGGLSYQQIAETMEAPINTIRTWLHRAKVELQNKISASYHDK